MDENNEQFTRKPEDELDDAPLDAPDAHALTDAPDAADSDESASDEYHLDLDSLNIDAALAALGSLTDVVAEREAEAARETARQAALKADAEEREAAARAAAEELARWKASYHMPRPPMVKVGRGRLASLIPGLSLMAIGAYLTFAYTTGSPPEPALLLGLGVGWVALALLAYWLTAGRWAGGALFGGLLIIAVGGVTAHHLLNALPLTFLLMLYGVAVGGALTLAGVLARPAHGALVASGLAMMIGSGVLWAAREGVLPAVLIEWASLAAPYVLIAALVLFLLPAVFKRRA